MKTIRAFGSVVLSFLLVILTYQSYGQKILTQSETEWVREAHYDLDRAFSDPSLGEKQRLELIYKGARTLKRYGQEPYPIDEKSQLRELMEGNYKLKQKQFIDANDLYGEINRLKLKQRMKLINRMQIETVEDQIKFIIPGLPTLDLSTELVTQVFDWNIVEGAHDGKVANARDIKNAFKELAKAGELSDKLISLRSMHKTSAKNLKKDLDGLDGLERKMRKAYKDQESSTFTERGYEGALEKDGINTIHNRHEIVGTWTYKTLGFYVFHRYNADGTVQYNVNGRQNNYTWEANGNMLKLVSRKGKVDNMGYLIKGNQLYYTNKRGRIKGHPLTRGF